MASQSPSRRSGAFGPRISASSATHSASAERDGVEEPLLGADASVSHAGVTGMAARSTRTSPSINGGGPMRLSLNGLPPDPASASPRRSGRREEAGTSDLAARLLDAVVDPASADAAAVTVSVRSRSPAQRSAASRSPARSSPSQSRQSMPKGPPTLDDTSSVSVQSTCLPARLVLIPLPGPRVADAPGGLKALRPCSFDGNLRARCSPLRVDFTT